MLLALHHDAPESESLFDQFRSASVLGGLKALDSRVRRKGLADLDPTRGALIPLGMEIENGRVVKNGYGVFDLSWQAERHPEWAERILCELDEIRSAIREAHGVPLQFLIWVGMGGSAEDKSMYLASGLMKRGPRCYVLDSTDPVKLDAILEDMKKRSGREEADLLRRTLVVGMAMGMTSYEPVVNLERIAKLYERARVDSRANICYMTLEASLLDRFASKRGYRRVPLQLDGADSTAGRHSSPLTRGSLYPLGLAGVDLSAWISGTFLSPEEIHTALRLAAFFQAQGLAGRDKITLLLPRAWAGAGIWTKQDFEESLGKSETQGTKIITGEQIRLTNYRAPKDALQDRVFCAIQLKGTAEPHAAKYALLRRAGYPCASLTLPAKTPLSRYMQFMHYAVFGLAWLRKVNFVTQPNVELYKAITNRLFAEAERSGGLTKTKEGRRTEDSPRSAVWRGSLKLRWDRLPDGLEPEGTTAPALYASLLKRLAAERVIEYGELTFFGDTRYHAPGRSLRSVLDRAGERLFRAALRIPVDIYEGPAVNHSYHEMIIGRGRCFSTLLIADSARPAAYHRAQFLATQMALEERGRHVVSLTLRNLDESTLKALEEFFRQVTTHVRARR